MYYKSFFKKYWWLLLVLLALPTVGLIVFCCKLKPGSEPGAWASMISGIFTYVGSTLLAVIVFYHTFVIDKKHELSETMKFTISPFADWSGIHFIPFSSSKINSSYTYFSAIYEGPSTLDTFDDFSFIEIRIQNLNKDYPLTVKIAGIYYIDTAGKVQECSNFVCKSKSDIHLPLDFKDKHEMYIGLPENILAVDFDKKQACFNLFLVLEFNDTLGKQLFAVEDYVLSSTFGTNRQRYSPKKYHKLIKKQGHPIVLTKTNRIHIKENLDFIRKQKEKTKGAEE